MTKAGAGKGAISADPLDKFTCGSTTCSGRYPLGTVVTLTAAPADAYSTFAGWTGLSAGCSVDLGNPAKLLCTLNADLSATATFTKPAVKLAVTVTGPAGKGYVTASPLPVGLSSAKCSITGPAGTTGTTICTWSYYAGTSVKLTATAAHGYKLLAWSGACTGSYSSCTVTMTSDRSVTATFARR